MEQGVLQGLERGLEQGREQSAATARLETLREVLLDVLASRFGVLDESIVARIRNESSTDTLRRLTQQAITAASLRDLGL